MTASCNLRCHMCLVRYRPPVGRRQGAMPFDRFRAIVDALPDLADVTLQGLGEPLLVPHLLDMVRHVKARGATVGFNTNATVLTRDRAQALVDAGLDWLACSLDGATAATYESIRDGARFDEVVANIAAMVEVRRAAGAANPAMRLVVVAMRRNVHELADIVRLAHELGVPAVSVQNLSHDFDDTGDDEAYVAIRSFTRRNILWRGTGDDAGAAAAFAQAAAVAAELGVDLRLPHLDPAVLAPRRALGQPGCDWPWQSTYVTFDGVVQPCCMVMGHDRASFGDLREQPLGEVWRGPRARRFRLALRTDEPPDVCRGCALHRRVF